LQGTGEACYLLSNKALLCYLIALGWDVGLAKPARATPRRAWLRSNAGDKFGDKAGNNRTLASSVILGLS